MPQKQYFVATSLPKGETPHALEIPMSAKEHIPTKESNKAQQE
jgi:hypothetical protein